MRVFFLFHTLVIVGIVHSGDKDGTLNFIERCTPPFETIGLGCYYINNDKVSGDEAFVRCLQHGGYLANLETLEEALALKSVLLSNNTGLHYYVGGRNINRYLPKGDWRWIKDGKMIPMAYYIFGPGEPNGDLATPQDCMFYYASQQYNIHNVMCYSSGYDGGYICEK